MQDSDHAQLVNRLPPKTGLLLGVTNPFFEKSCVHWPHVLSLGRRVQYVIFLSLFDRQIQPPSMKWSLFASIILVFHLHGAHSADSSNWITLGTNIRDNDYHTPIIRTTFTRILPILIPEVYDEVVHAFNDIVPATEGKVEHRRLMSPRCNDEDTYNWNKQSGKKFPS
jgi:hypothetical protein